MIKLNFKISEFNISNKDIPQEVADKILEHHILPMQQVRNELGIIMMPSQRSGYRPKEWELSKGRSGNSQHCFDDNGAVDWTCEDFTINKDKFLASIIKHTRYTRMAIYNTFIHCDYKTVANGKRQLFDSDSKSKWTFKRYIEASEQA